VTYHIADIQQTHWRKFDPSLSMSVGLSIIVVYGDHDIANAVHET